MSYPQFFTTSVPNGPSRPVMLQDPDKLPCELHRRHKAWKYYGYPAFSRFIASSSDYAVFRRFSVVANRALLLLQHRIAKREAELAAMDQRSMLILPEDACGCGSFEADTGTDREEVITELSVLLKQYYELFGAFSSMRALPLAREWQVRNVKTWMEDYPSAVAGPSTAFDESAFIEEDGDLVSLVTKVQPPLRRVLERSSFLQRCFAIPPKKGDFVDSATSYHSGKAFDRCTDAIIILFGLCMIIGPMWGLYYVADGLIKIGVISGATLLFAILLISATVANPFQVLGGAAAYAAVLVVFLQFIGSASHDAAAQQAA